MTDLHVSVVNALKQTNLPVYYELVVNAGTATPCITYMGLTDFVQAQTDVSDIRSVSYQIKIWSTEVSDLQTYAAAIDGYMRAIDFVRTSTTELHDINSTMIYKALTYEKLVDEKFN